VAKDNRLCDQLRGAALSIMNNIAEGWESLSPGEKRQCYGYARRSCGEVRSMIYVLVDNFPETPDDLIKDGWNTCLHTGKLITGLIAAAERQAKRKTDF
jgi:four helix bundle protein